MTRPAAVVLALVLVHATPALAQPGVEWLKVQRDDSRLAAPVLSSSTDEVDMAPGDLDQDGWIDVVVARSAPGPVHGPRTNVLLRNDHGILRDETAALASASDVPGDLGFLTPVHDRGVELADLDGDGLLDAVTAPMLGGALPKALSHPRVYRNLGFAAATWLGLRHEDARIPQFLTSVNLLFPPNFNDVAVADVDLDGDLDLYFTVRFVSSPLDQPRDRLLHNDGFGFFSDVTLLAFNSQQVFSGLGSDSTLEDLNLDGTPDLVRVGYNSQNSLAVRYNDPQAPGSFKTLLEHSMGMGGNEAAVATPDLNTDGRPDVVASANAVLGYRLNMGVRPATHQVQWGALNLAVYASMPENIISAGSNVVVSDLDLNGFPDLLVSSVVPGFLPDILRGRIYHNLAAAPGVFNVILKEEAEFANNDLFGAGWKGAVGLSAGDLRSAYDFGVADFDRDGDDDFLLGHANGMAYYENRTVVCQQDLGFGGPGDLALRLCGDALETGGTATLSLTHATPGSMALLFLGLAANPTFAPPVGGTLVPIPVQATLTLPIPASGDLHLAVPGGGGPITVYAQAVAPQPGAHEVSNALKIDLLP